MKCQRCDGLIILERGICGAPDRLKCAICGRDPNAVEALNQHGIGQEGEDDMEEEIKEKVCARCKKSIPATDEFWYRDKKTKDGFSYWCKACHRRARLGRASKKGIKPPVVGSIRQSKKRNFKVEYKKRKKRDPGPLPIIRPSLITATPEEIIKALRKGVAQEIIQTIQEKFA